MKITMLFRLGCLMAGAFLIGACSSDESSSDGTITHETAEGIPSELTGDTIPGSPTAECPDQPSYTPDKLIATPEEVAAGMAEFRANHPTDTITGGVFSRAALEELLCAANTSGIGFYMVQDPADSDGKPGKIYVVLAGGNVPDPPGADPVERTSAWYKPNNWCPPTCVVVE